MGGRMSRRRETDDNDEDDILDFNQERAFDSDIPLEEDNESDESLPIETDDLAASIVAFILRNR